MIDRKQLLQHAKAQKATDIHICAGAPILFRAGGHLAPSSPQTQARRLLKNMLQCLHLGRVYPCVSK